MPILNPNSTNYVHGSEPNTSDLTMAMDYNTGGQPSLRVNNFYVDVAAGTIPYHFINHKFGAVPAMSQNTTGTIWDVNDTLYPWAAFTTASVVNVDRDSASDAGKTVKVVGLDENYNQQEEDIVLTDASNNLGTKLWKRVFRAFTSDGVTNVGNIDIQINSTTVARITANKGQTLMAVYTVPAGYTGYLFKGICSAQASADGTGDMFVRYGGTNSFRVGHSFEVSGVGGAYVYDFTFPIKLPEKTDIDVRITTRTNNGRYTAAFDMLIINTAQL
jgi:hypothetical protein